MNNLHKSSTEANLVLTTNALGSEGGTIPLRITHGAFLLEDKIGEVPIGATLGLYEEVPYKTSFFRKWKFRGPGQPGDDHRHRPGDSCPLCESLEKLEETHGSSEALERMKAKPFDLRQDDLRRYAEKDAIFTHKLSGTIPPSPQILDLETGEVLGQVTKIDPNSDQEVATRLAVAHIESFYGIKPDPVLDANTGEEILE